MSTTDDLTRVEDPTTYFGYRWPGADPLAPSLPVRWSAAGGVDDVVRAGEAFEGTSTGEGPEPDAHARGWIATDGQDRGEALFVLAGPTLGVGRDEQSGPPMWLDLRRLVNLDALGDPAPGPRGEVLQEVEIRMEDGEVLRAGWTLPFCDRVVATLERLAGRTTDEGPDVRIEEVPDARPPAPEPPREPDAALPTSGASAFSTAPTARADGERRAAEPAPAPEAAPEPEAAPAPEAAVVPGAAVAAPQGPPAEASGPGTLELEDVVYLGGYPGHHKKRKRCTATLGRAGLELAGPGDLHFRLSWDVVRTIEVQNADEARFRMNAKIHRDASALVVECDQGVTILLEARDCPTLALRAAIGQLLDDTSVVVV